VDSTVALSVGVCINKATAVCVDAGAGVFASLMGDQELIVAGRSQAARNRQPISIVNNFFIILL
jgi:hypothetical protein